MKRTKKPLDAADKAPATFSIGATLRRLREAKGWSVSEMSERIDRSVSTVERIEASAGVANMTAFGRACDALGVSAEQLLFKRRDATDRSDYDRQITAIFRKALAPPPTTRGRPRRRSA